MRKFILSILVLSLFICSVIPASATSNDLFYINLLDYGYAAESGSNTQSFSGSTELTFTYDLPDRSIVQYVDIVFTYAANDTVDIEWYSGAGSNRGNLTVVRVYGAVYRAYGSCSAFYTDSVVLKFITDTSTSNRITIQSLNVGRTSYSYDDIEAYCEIISDSYNGTIHYVPTDEVNYRTFTGVSDATASGFNLMLYTEEWQRFDYVDFTVIVTCSGISSISTNFMGMSAPLEYSFVESTYFGYPSWVINFRLDLTEIDRTADDYPSVNIAGAFNLGEFNAVSVFSCIGIVGMGGTDANVYWYSKILNSIQSGFEDLNAWIDSQTSSLVESIEQLGEDIIAALQQDDSTLDDEFSSQATEAISQLTDVQDSFNSVSKPDVDSINPVSDISNSGADMTLLSPVIGVVFTSPTILSIFLISLSFALIGYVLYGKR